MAEQALENYSLRVDPYTEIGPNYNPALQTKLQRLELLQALVDKVASKGAPVPRGDSYSPKGGGQAFIRSATKSLIDNAMAVPELVGGLTAQAGQDALRDIKNMVTPRPIPDRNSPDFWNQQKAQTAEIEALANRPLFPRLSLPGSREAFGAGRIAGEVAGAVSTGDFSQFTKNPAAMESLISEAGQDKYPGTDFLGGITGDAATLGLLRSPLSSRLSKAEAKVEEKIAQSVAAEKFATAQGLPQGFFMQKGFKEAVEHMRASPNARALARTMGRSLQVGGEGAVLGLLKDDDPVAMAAYGSGLQLAGSAALAPLTALKSGSFHGLGGKILASAMAISALGYAAQNLSPGQNDIPEAIDTAFSKVLFLAGLGVVSGMSGAGRVPARWGTVLADQMTAIPRAAALSAISDWRTDSRVEVVVSKMRTDPFYFGQTAARRLDRAFRNPSISISEVITEMMDNKDFRDKYEALDKSK